jgi:hypothetical protein
MDDKRQGDIFKSIYKVPTRSLQRGLVADALVDAADAMIAARVAAVAMVCGGTRSFERPTGRSSSDQSIA